jgi:hypothetical protein
MRAYSCRTQVLDHHSVDVLLSILVVRVVAMAIMRENDDRGGFNGARRGASMTLPLQSRPIRLRKTPAFG